MLLAVAANAGIIRNSIAAELKDDKAQTHLSFKGQEASFDLKLGQTVRIVEGNIGEKEIKLLSVTAENVEVSLSGGMYEDWRNEVMLGRDIAFVMGGKEQMGILQLLAVKDNTAKFKIRFGNAPPAPEVPDDMPIDIIYSN